MLVREINIAKCFAVIADETTDVSGVEQFSICLRYINKKDREYCIREDFLQFVPVEDFTGKGLADTIISTLTKKGVNLSYLKGQGKRDKTLSSIFIHCSEFFRL